MPEFKADTDGFMKKPSGFKMKGWSAFTKMKKKSKGEMQANPDHGFAGQVASTMKMTVKLPPHNKNTPGVRPALMKIDDKKSPHETIQNLRSKKEAGTITKAELKKLDKLTKKWDKIFAGDMDDDRG